MHAECEEISVECGRGQYVNASSAAARGPQAPEMTSFQVEENFEEGYENNVVFFFFFLVSLFSVFFSLLLIGALWQEHFFFF